MLIVKNIKRLCGLIPAGRSHKVYSDDIHLVSYPRSGNTWLRFLVGNILYPNHQTTFRNVDQRIPDIYKNTIYLKYNARPRILKSHEYFDPRYSTIVYLVRDPRDVAISYYYHLLKKKFVSSEELSLDDFGQKFINFRGFRTETWREHVVSWMATRSPTKTFLLVRYEDLLEDAEGQLKRICEFLQLKRSPKEVSCAVEKASFSRMRQDESTHGSYFSGSRNSDKKISFVRSGKSGQWKTQLSDEAVNSISSAWQDTMRNLGYL